MGSALWRARYPSSKLNWLTSSLIENMYFPVSSLASSMIYIFMSCFLTQASWRSILLVLEQKPSCTYKVKLYGMQAF